MDGEQYEAILHKNHGWIEAPEGCLLKREGAMIYLIDNNEYESGTIVRYPYGTAWRVTSVIAYSTPTEEA